MPRFTVHRPRPGSRALVVLATGIALTLAACGENQAVGSAMTTPPAPASTQSSVSRATAPPTASQPSSPATQPTTSAGEAAAAPAKPPIANAVTVATPGMSFDVSGPLRPGIAAITLTNTDDAAHMMAVARLKDGVTLKQVTDALAKSEDAAGALLADSPDTSYGTPSMVGAGQSTTVTALNLPAGHYALICFLPGADGMAHWQMGMIDELSVTGDPATEKPASDGTIAIDDNGITLPAGFTGSGTFEVTNRGASPHGLSLARLDAGTSLADFAGHVGMAENSGKPVDGGGGVLAGGVDVLAPGQTAFLTLALRPGHYGYLSPEDMQGPQLPPQHGEFDVR